MKRRRDLGGGGGSEWLLWRCQAFLLLWIPSTANLGQRDIVLTTAQPLSFWHISQPVSQQHRVMGGGPCENDEQQQQQQHDLLPSKRPLS